MIGGTFGRPDEGGASVEADSVAMSWKKAPAQDQSQSIVTRVDLENDCQPGGRKGATELLALLQAAIWTARDPLLSPRDDRC